MNFFDSLKWFLLPYSCVFCEEITDRGVIFCEECKKEIIMNPHYSAIPNSENNLFCCLSAFHYSDQKIRQAILNLKFNGSKETSTIFADFLSKIESNILKNADCVTCVPLSKARKRWRGYNQSELIGSAYANFVGKPYEELIVKLKSNKAQSKIQDDSKRRKNVEKVYKACQPEKIKGKTIIVVDDVFTTGATLNECAKVLKKAGAQRVIGLTVAYARK